MTTDAQNGMQLETKTETLFDLEAQVHALHDDVVKPALVMIGDLLKVILYGDGSVGPRYKEQGDFRTVRQYCEHRLGWSYEYCRTLIRAGDVAATYPQLGSVSAHAANELAKLAPAARDVVVDAIVQNNVEPTGAAVKFYREALVGINADRPIVSTTYVELSNSVDRRIELQVVALLQKHSDPMAALLSAQKQMRTKCDEDHTHTKG